MGLEAGNLAFPLLSIRHFRSLSGCLRQAFLNLLQRFPDEGRLVLRRSGGDEVAVHDNLLIHVMSACIGQVIAQRRVAGQRASFGQTRADQNLRSMADRGDRLALLVELLHEGLNIAIVAKSFRDDPPGITTAW